MISQVGLGEEYHPSCDLAAVEADIGELIESHASGVLDDRQFFGAQFDRGLAWPGFPLGLGGRGCGDPAVHVLVESAIKRAGAPWDDLVHLTAGPGVIAPTIVDYGTEEQKSTLLRPLWTGEELWCQLYSEPGAGSDLASLATSAVQNPDGSWVVNGQKVWSSFAHQAAWGLLVARTDADVPKHQGITCFLVRMDTPGVDVRPLRMISGDAHFNEVFLTDVMIPDTQRLGEVGQGWEVTRTSLLHERVSIGAAPVRETGNLAAMCRAWRADPDAQNLDLYGKVMDTWIDAEVTRLFSTKLAQKFSSGTPTAEGAALKILTALVEQRAGAIEFELRGAEALRFDYAISRTTDRRAREDTTAYRYLFAKGLSIAGGTSEILRNSIAESVLGLPQEPNPYKRTPWKEIPR